MFPGKILLLLNFSLSLSRIVVPARKEAFKLFNADESSQLLQVRRTRARAAPGLVRF